MNKVINHLNSNNAEVEQASTSASLSSKSINHLAVIMDGNRRWAKANNLLPNQGHQAGVKALKLLVKLCPKYKIKHLTAYTFSTENWRRNSKELDFLFKLLGSVAVNEMKDLIDANVRVKFIGDLDAFKSYSMYESIKELEEATKHNDLLTLNIALNYGGLDELSNALNTLKTNYTAEEMVDLSLEDFSQHLYTKECPDPEMVIRTGGQKRLSNFLIWQSADSYLHFIDKMWPDFNEQDLQAALEAYMQESQEEVI